MRIVAAYVAAIAATIAIANAVGGEDCGEGFTLEAVRVGGVTVATRCMEEIEGEE